MAKCHPDPFNLFIFRVCNHKLTDKIERIFSIWIDIPKHVCEVKSVAYERPQPQPHAQTPAIITIIGIFNSYFRFNLILIFDD